MGHPDLSRKAHLLAAEPRVVKDRIHGLVSAPDTLRSTLPQTVMFDGYAKKYVREREDYDCWSVGASIDVLGDGSDPVDSNQLRFIA